LYREFVKGSFRRAAETRSPRGDCYPDIFGQHGVIAASLKFWQPFESLVER